MKKLNIHHIIALSVVASLTLAAPLAHANGDLVLGANDVRLSTQSLLEGRTVRIYATVHNQGQDDIRGVVRFFDGDRQITGDQPVSVVSGREDAVFVDWAPLPGERTLKVVVVPLDKADDGNNGNNTYVQTLHVLADADRDGVPNATDPDDDNDTYADTTDSFPLDKKEWSDADGDAIGDNADIDDDNDGIPDAEDEFPLDATESHDNDKDAIGNNSDTDDDNDGMADVQELQNVTDPLKADTDTDGLNDKEENEIGTNPRNTDSDGDKVTDKNDPYPLDPTRSTLLEGAPTGSQESTTPPAPETVEVNVATDPTSTSHYIYPGQTVEFTTPSTGTTETNTTIKEVEWSLDGNVVERIAFGNNGENGTVESLGTKSEGETITKDVLESSARLATKPASIKLRFGGTGTHTLQVKVTNEDGSIQQAISKLYVVTGKTSWIIGILALTIALLAIFYVFTYSRPRAKKRTKNALL